MQKEEDLTARHGPTEASEAPAAGLKLLGWCLEGRKSVSGGVDGVVRRYSGLDSPSDHAPVVAERST